jgi:hypothetical protein
VVIVACSVHFAESDDTIAQHRPAPALSTVYSMNVKLRCSLVLLHDFVVFEMLL